LPAAISQPSTFVVVHVLPVLLETSSTYVSAVSTTGTPLPIAAVPVTVADDPAPGYPTGWPVTVDTDQSSHQTGVAIRDKWTARTAHDFP
jgi:hypothetical protein